MDKQQKQRTIENEKKWKHFLSSIKRVHNFQTNNVCINSKINTKCLANEFANKLLKKKGGFIEISGSKNTMETYKHFNVKEPQTQPHNIDFNDRNQVGMSRADTWPKERSKYIEPYNISDTDSARRQLSFETTKTIVCDSSDEEMSPNILKPIPSEKLGYHWKSQPRFDIPNEIDLSPSKKIKFEKELFADKTMESRTEQATGSSKEVQEKYEQEEEATLTELDNNEPGATSMSEDNMSSHVGNVKIIRKIDIVTNPISIKSDIDNSYRDTVRRIEKSTDFSEAPEDGERNGSTEPGADTVIAVQAENRKGTTKNKVNNRPVTLQVSADDIFHIKANFEINRLRDRNENIPKSKKSDIDKSCSKWTIPNIAEYFDFDKSVRKIEMPTYFAIGAEKVSENIQLELIQKLQVFKSVQIHKSKQNNDKEIISHLKSLTATECGSRLVLDSLLIPLCASLGLNIEVDKNINCNFLPNCRFDYCIAKGDKLIGCVETKSIKSLNDSAVAQALMQLLILQTNLLRVDDPLTTKCPLFAIVTDGHRFVYIQLQESVFKFEHEGEKCKVREIAHEDDVKCIFEQIGYLMNEATAALKGTNLGSCTVIETNSTSSNNLVPNVINLDDQNSENPHIIVID
ncbi:unnamed protein product [Mytilus edulis]|uniref:Uncharacterized protein n=1 Tax=Mytilus edulis TaxID=6550 RepID=A0A8S3REW5_MYTED|nr:unnamed protein product [Mytilus edulis]